MDLGMTLYDFLLSVSIIGLAMRVARLERAVRR